MRSNQILGMLSGQGLAAWGQSLRLLLASRSSCIQASDTQLPGKTQFATGLTGMGLSRPPAWGTILPQALTPDIQRSLPMGSSQLPRSPSCAVSDPAQRAGPCVSAHGTTQWSLAPERNLFPGQSSQNRSAPLFVSAV